MEKYGRAGEAIGDNILLRMLFVCWINKSTDTHSKHVIFIVFHGNNYFATAPHVTFILTLSLWFLTILN